MDSQRLLVVSLAPASSEPTRESLLEQSIDLGGSDAEAMSGNRIHDDATDGRAGEMRLVLKDSR